MGRRRVCLVVEEDAALRHMLVERLDAVGCVTIAAGDADEATRLVAALDEAPRGEGVEPIHIDLILTEWCFDRDGVDVVAALGRLSPTRHAPALIVTGFAGQLPDWALRRTNLRGVIRKPFSIRSVLRQAEQLLHDPRDNRQAA
jgi:CheY-like chemotaxis protein